MDALKILLIVGVATLVIAAISIAMFAWASPGSRNVALATGTLGAAIILLFVQLSFELRGSEYNEFISVEFTIDHLKPEIRQWVYPSTVGWRISSEIGASKWLSDNKPDLFAKEPEKVTKDLAVFSLITYLATSQYDWQLKKLSFSGQSIGTITTFERVSKPHECTVLQEKDLRDQLSRASNAFAQAKLWLVGGPLCLPPKTSLILSPTRLRLENMFYVITFDFEPANAVFYVKPGTGGETPSLPNGKPQFETRIIGIHIKVRQFGLRSQHRHSALYREWSSRLVEGAHAWFEDRDN